jgi:hypothetical protein
MGKKPADGAMGEGSIEAEIEGLKMRLQKMEEVM